MAQQIDEDLDLGIEEPAKPKKKIMIIVSSAVLAILLLGLGLGWYLLSEDAADQTQKAGQAQDDSESVQRQEQQLPAIYHRLDPLFIVNLPPGGSVKMLQVGIQVMLRSPELVEFIQHHDPMIRHTLLNLLGSQESASLQQRQGKERLQADVVRALNKLIDEQHGPGSVEAVYFTSFVMQ